MSLSYPNYCLNQCGARSANLRSQRLGPGRESHVTENISRGPANFNLEFRTTSNHFLKATRELAKF